MVNCPKCEMEMIDAKATNFGETYKYCRNCKKELKEMQVEPKYITILRYPYSFLPEIDLPQDLLIMNHPKHKYDPMTRRCTCGSMIGKSRTGLACVASNVTVTYKAPPPPDVV